MRVIIPAAGAGSRFAAYTRTPKILMPVVSADGHKPMIRHVIDMVRDIDERPIVVCQQDTAYQVAKMGTEVVPIRTMQHGAALSVLCANGFLHDSESVMIVDSDVVFGQEHFNRYVNDAISAANVGSACAISTEIVQHGAYSYIHGFGGQIGYVREKEAVSQRICAGAHTFPAWSQLRKAICQMVAEDLRVKNEFYLAPVHNLKQWRNSFYHDVPRNEWWHLGTPESLLQWEERFASK